MIKILLFEDDPVMSRMYKKMFTYEGYGVEVAHDGEEGLKKTKTFKPDLILLDVMMPKMNGLEALEKLKADPETRSIIVVLLTNLGVREEIDRAFSLGAVKYIEKANHEPRKVLDMVKEILARAKR